MVLPVSYPAPSGGPGVIPRPRRGPTWGPGRQLATFCLRHELSSVDGTGHATGGPGQGGVMIEASGLSKRYGPVRAVDNLSFTIEPGSVTGFLGPNRSGKSTTMSMIP